MMSNSILGRNEENKIVDLYQLPFINEAEQPDELLLAIILQNAHHTKNNQRVTAVTEGSYIGMLTSKKANEYMAYLINDNLLKRLRAAESTIVAKYQGSASKDLAVKILAAPDLFYATAMMKHESVFFGKGDFQNILEVLKTQKSNKYRDIGNKLMVIK